MYIYLYTIWKVYARCIYTVHLGMRFAFNDIPLSRYRFIMLIVAQMMVEFDKNGGNCLNIAHCISLLHFQSVNIHDFIQKYWF